MSAIQTLELNNLTLAIVYGLAVAIPTYSITVLLSGSAKESLDFGILTFVFTTAVILLMRWYSG